MSTTSYSMDLNGVLKGGYASRAAEEAAKKKAKHATGEEGANSLNMTDYLTLMVQMLKNQDMDNTADMGQMMSQMVQMSVVQAITDISSLVSESTALNYAASLVGKEVTIGQYDSNDKIKEIVGTVTGTGTYNGEQVIFIGNDTYKVSDVMAVGRLPEKKEENTGTGTKPETGKPEADKPKAV